MFLAAVGERRPGLAPSAPSGVFAPAMIDGPMDGESFWAWVEPVLLPALGPDDGVVMDHRSTPKTAVVREAFARQGIAVLFLPAYAPDLNPIENLGSKVKSFLRRCASRCLESLMDAAAEALDAVTEDDDIDYFKNAGYSGHVIS